jgi:hypothetical protein
MKKTKHTTLRQKKNMRKNTVTKPASLKRPPTDSRALEKEIRPPIITCRRFNNIKIIVNKLKHIYKK